MPVRATPGYSFQATAHVLAGATTTAQMYQTFFTTTQLCARAELRQDTRKLSRKGLPTACH